MVDFKALSQRIHDEATPERRAAMDGAAAREARHAATELAVTGHFATLGQPRLTLATGGLRALGRPTAKPGDAAAPVETETWEAPVRIRIEDVTTHDGRPKEIIRFLDAVTGFEAYDLDERFAQMVVGQTDFRWDRDRLVICGGTPGGYSRCWIDRKDVEAYLRERRPKLFGGAALSPAADSGVGAAPSRPRIDYAKMASDSYEKATPGGKARIDLRREREARADETEAEMVGHFERRGLRRPRPARLDIRFLGRPAAPAAKAGDGLAEFVEREWTKPLRVRIEERDVGNGDVGEVIRFLGGSGGPDAYRLDGQFASVVAGEGGGADDRFYVCAGRADGTVDGVWVERDALEAYLRDRRPGLFPDATPRP